VCDRFGGLELFDAEKIYSNSPDLFRDKVVGRIPGEIRVVPVDRLVTPMFAATSVDDNNIIPRNFPVCAPIVILVRLTPSFCRVE